MSYDLDYDTSNRVVYITTAPTGGNLSLSVPDDVYSVAKYDWKNTSALNKFKFPFAFPVGGNIITPGKLLAPYVYIRYGWKMRPYEADHALYLTDGSLVDPTGADPWLPTIGNYTVNVRDVIPSDARTLETGVSGLTAQESQALLDIAADQAQIQLDISSMNIAIGTITLNITEINLRLTSVERELRRALGLMQENYSMDQQVYTDYQGQKLMTSARIRLYSHAKYKGTEQGIVEAYRLESQWSGQENISYTVMRLYLNTTSTTTSTTSTTTT